MAEQTPRPRARRAPLVETNPELALRLRDWASTNLKSPDSYLNGLADAIETGVDLPVWASTDVMNLFPQPYVRIRENRLQANLNLLRTALVFVPVGLTWFAVGKATSAFAAYTAASNSGVANFLTFWQNGKGYLSSEWTIGHVAFFDFLIIMGVIALSVSTPIMAQREEKKMDNAIERAERERIAIMVDVMKYLFDKKEINSVTMNSQLARTVASLRTATKALSDSAKRIEKATKQIKDRS
jgi:predicted transcriptional regulator